MSCGSGYLSGNMLRAFPFEDATELACPEDALPVLSGIYRCFVDASLFIKEAPGQVRPYLSDFSATVDSLSFSLRVGGHSTSISVARASDQKFPIVSGMEIWGNYMIVLSSEGVSDFCANSHNIPSLVEVFNSSSSTREGSCFAFCNKFLTYSPRSLSSISVYNGVDPKEDGPHFIVSGDVSIRAGNNMVLGQDEDDSQAVSIAAEPGAGTGKIPCISDQVASSKPLLAGPYGHVRIFNDTCYDLEPNTKTGQIMIHAKCTACCTCEMYESIVNDRLAKLAEVVRTARGFIQEMYQDYESAVAAFNSRISRPTLSDFSLSLSGMPIGAQISPKIGNKDVKGKMERCVFTATLANNSYFDVSASVSLLTGSDEVVESTAVWTDKAGEPLSETVDGAISGTYDVYPGRSLVITFVAAHKDMVSSVTTGGFTGDISLNIAWDGGAIGALSKSIEV